MAGIAINTIVQFDQPFYWPAFIPKGTEQFPLPNHLRHLHAMKHILIHCSFRLKIQIRQKPALEPFV